MTTASSVNQETPAIQTTPLNKACFKIFKSCDINSSRPRTYRKYKVGGASEDIPADYIVVGDDIYGTGIRDKSQTSNNVIRLNFRIMDDKDGTTYYRGTINLTEEGLAALKAETFQPENQRSGVFGTMLNKDKSEVDLAGWVCKSDAGKMYINCQLSL